MDPISAASQVIVRNHLAASHHGDANFSETLLHQVFDTLVKCTAYDGMCAVIVQVVLVLSEENEHVYVC